MNTRKILTFLAVFTAVGMWAEEAAAKKKGPLEGEPIVRKKLQLRRFRFQLTPFVGMSLSQPFVHMGYIGAKATFHFADWIGARGTFAYGIVPVESKLLKAVNDGGLPSQDDMGAHAPNTDDPTLAGDQICMGNAPCRTNAQADNPAPLLHDFRAGLVRAQWQASVDAVFTPFSGKLGLFSAIFTEYDIYVFGGLGLVGYNKHYDNRSTAQLEGLDTSPDSPSYCSAGAGQNQECLLHPVSAEEGVKIGGSFGGGLHLFLAKWVSLDFEIQDIVVGVNLTGLNRTVRDIPPVVNADDRFVFHNVTLQVGPKFYFPFKAKRTK
jgi:hypothetical protein